MRVAIIHDWLLGMRGGERCLEILCRLFRNPDIYTVFYDAQNISAELNSYKPRASILQKFPNVKNYYRYLLPLYPLGAHDLSRKITRSSALKDYDLVVSVSHCAAKNVIVPNGVEHVCYCLTPMRYIWDQFDAYFKGRALFPMAKLAAAPLRQWDVRGARNVDYFVAISEYIRARIGQVYDRTSNVIYPPVETSWIKPVRSSRKGHGFLCVNALVPYKNVDVIVETFNVIGEELTIVGTGPEESRLKRMAKGNIKFAGFVKNSELAQLYASSRAMIFAAEEDFGMTPVEMQAAGRPVIALGRGGALETINSSLGKESGLFFSELTVESLSAAVLKFIDSEQNYTVENCIRQSEHFSTSRFVNDFINFFNSKGYPLEYHGEDFKRQDVIYA